MANLVRKRTKCCKESFSCFVDGTVKQVYHIF